MRISTLQTFKTESFKGLTERRFQRIDEKFSRICIFCLRRVLGIILFSEILGFSLAFLRFYEEFLEFNNFWDFQYCLGFCGDFVVKGTRSLQ